MASLFAQIERADGQHIAFSRTGRTRVVAGRPTPVGILIDVASADAIFDPHLAPLLEIDRYPLSAERMGRDGKMHAVYKRRPDHAKKWVPACLIDRVLPALSTAPKAKAKSKKVKGSGTTREKGKASTSKSGAGRSKERAKRARSGSNSGDDDPSNRQNSTLLDSSPVTEFLPSKSTHSPIIDSASLASSSNGSKRRKLDSPPSSKALARSSSVGSKGKGRAAPPSHLSTSSAKPPLLTHASSNSASRPGIIITIDDSDDGCERDAGGCDEDSAEEGEAQDRRGLLL